jgi:hypothetical protein
MDWAFDLFGIVLLAAGVLMAVWKRKRKFERINHYGHEGFPSYWARLRARTYDELLLLLSLGLVGAGVLVLAYQHQDTWGWFVIMPVMLWVLFLMIGT